MHGPQVIAEYERVLSVMQQMHEAARTERWDDLVALERSCRSIVERLMGGEAGTPLAPPEARRKLAIVRQLLALDAAIRNKTEPWLAQLQGLMSASRRTRKLHQAYGAPDGA